MKSIILAAGRGKRIMPLTRDVPKGMIKFFGKSLIEHQIYVLKKCGINEIYIVKGYLSEKINFKNVGYFINEKYDSTNMLETLFCAREALNDAVIVSYGDIIFEEKILRKLISSPYDISVIVDKNWKKYWEMRFSEPLLDAESLSTDSKGSILSIGQKVNNISEIEGQYIGLMKFQGKGLEDLKNFYDKAKKYAEDGKNILNSKSTFENSFMTDFLQALISNGIEIKPIFIENGWLEFDSIEDYELYQKKIDDDTISEIISLNSLI